MQIELNILPPIINNPNTDIHMMKIGNKDLDSSIISIINAVNISSFERNHVKFSDELITSFLQPNLIDNITNKQNKLQPIKIGKKIEIPKISNEQLTVLSNKKMESKTINDQVNKELDKTGNDSQKSEANSLYRKDGAYNKMSKRYDLNSSNFSPIRNLIDNKKISTEKKERELKKYLARNDSEMKKMSIFEKFKDIFGMSKKINILRNQQNNDTKIIFNGLSSLHNSIVNKDTF
ncbi:hypothetical protein [Proteus penneri]|uniref:Uncharacterized protein n=1 Tax=Proteus penneri TaxID=102862 RepID=A0A0G4Q3N8_9GAMM|nr:hypothetical protein [Proteus penneri]CRL60455.1 hypothetical protein BN1804_00973 [Proteus penneri]